MNASVTFRSELLNIDLAMPEREAILTATCLTLVIILTLVGNILVVLTVLTTRALRTVPNYFIVSLAVADLTVAVAVLPLSVVNLVLGRWPFGSPACIAWLTCDVVCCTASILNLCAIAIDRYRAIADPVDYYHKRTLGLVLVMIAVVWSLSLLISAPPLFGWTSWQYKGGEMVCELSRDVYYVFISACGSFYFPLCVMSVANVQIYRAIKRRVHSRAKSFMAVKMKDNSPSAAISMDQETALSSDSIDSILDNVEPSQIRRKPERSKEKSGNRAANGNVLMLGERWSTIRKSFSVMIRQESTVPGKRPTSIKRSASVNSLLEERQQISLSKERRAARILGIVMAVFVLCWLPFFLMYVTAPFYDIPKPVVDFITWLGYVNSALNPILYTVFNLDFRRGFKKLLHMKN